MWTPRWSCSGRSDRGRGERQQPWIGEDLGKLPWWRGEAEDLDDGSWRGPRGPAVDHGVGRRGKGDAAAFLRRAAEALGISVEALAGRSKTQTIVWVPGPTIMTIFWFCAFDRYLIA